MSKATGQLNARLMGDGTAATSRDHYVIAAGHTLQRRKFTGLKFVFILQKRRWRPERVPRETSTLLSLDSTGSLIALSSPTRPVFHVEHERFKKSKTPCTRRDLWITLWEIY